MNNEENNLFNNQPVNNNMNPGVPNIPPMNNGMGTENPSVQPIFNGTNEVTQNIEPVNEMVQTIPNVETVNNDMFQATTNLQPLNNNINPGIPNVPSMNTEMNQEVVPPVNNEIVPPVETMEPTSEPVNSWKNQYNNNGKDNNKYVPLLVLGGIIAFVAVAYFTLFSTKTLECTMTDSETGMKMKQTMKVSFKNNSITKLGMATKITLDDEYMDYIDMLESSLEEEFETQFADYMDKKGVTMNNKTKGNVLLFELEADLTKMDEETKEELDMVGKSDSYDEVKKSFEEEGYTCK